MRVNLHLKHALLCAAPSSLPTFKPTFRQVDDQLWAPPHWATRDPILLHPNKSLGFHRVHPYSHFNHARSVYLCCLFFNLGAAGGWQHPLPVGYYHPRIAGPGNMDSPPDLVKLLASGPTLLPFYDPLSRSWDWKFQSYFELRCLDSGRIRRL
jgi:hypothetical protein